MYKYRNQKNMLLMVGFLLLIMVMVVGCSNKEDDKKGNEENNTTVDNGEWEGQTIKVLLVGGFKMESSTDPITGETVAGVEVLKEEFESQHPGATVEFILIPWDGYTEKTQAMLTSKEADVYQMPGIADFSAQGYLEPLQPYIDQDKEFELDIFIDNQVNGWKVLAPDSDELEIFGLPFLGDARIIAFDKQIFDEWNVEYLSEYPTMEEVLEKAEKMTGTNPVSGEQNYGAWFQGNKAPFTLVNLAEGQNGSWGKGFAWDEIEFTFNSTEMVNGLSWLLDIQDFAPEGFISNQGNEKWLTEDNNIAIMLNQAPGNVTKPAYAQGLEDRIGIVQEFKNDSGIGGMFAGSPFTIAKNSENKELAWEWLKFATSDFAQKYVFEEMGGMPAVKSALEWESVQEQELMVPVLEAMKSPWTPRYPWGASQPRFILTSEIEAALTGKRTAEEALDKAQKESTEWLENR